MLLGPVPPSPSTGVAGIYDGLQDTRRANTVRRRAGARDPTAPAIIRVARGVDFAAVGEIAIAVREPCKTRVPTLRVHANPVRVVPVGTERPTGTAVVPVGVHVDF